MATTVTATYHDHDGHSSENREKLKPYVQLSSFNIVGLIGRHGLWPSLSKASFIVPGGLCVVTLFDNCREAAGVG